MIHHKNAKIKKLVQVVIDFKAKIIARKESEPIMIKSAVFQEDEIISVLELMDT